MDLQHNWGVKLDAFAQKNYWAGLLDVMEL